MSRDGAFVSADSLSSGGSNFRDKSPRSNSVRSNSPRSSKGSLGSWLRKKGSKTTPPPLASPEPPRSKVSSSSSREAKSGVITVRRAEVFKLGVKNDPWVEISVGDIVIGRTPRCSLYDRNPSWDHTLRIHEFRSGGSVLVSFMHKKGFPQKEVEAARGILLLSNELLLRRAIDEDVDIFLPAKDGGQPRRYGEEHLASVRLSIDFERPIEEIEAEQRRAHKKKQEEEARARSQASSVSGSSRKARSKTLMDEEGSEEEDQEADGTSANGEWDPVPISPGHARDNGAGVFTPSSAKLARQRLIEKQYWGRAPRSPTPVLCTDAMMILLRSLKAYLMKEDQHLHPEA